VRLTAIGRTSLFPGVGGKVWNRREGDADGHSVVHPASCVRFLGLRMAYRAPHRLGIAVLPNVVLI
jgi:hypothetical protein